MSRHVFLATTLSFILLALVSHCSSTDTAQIKGLQSEDDANQWQLSQPEKRNSWQNFQGSWGKRDSDDLMEEKRNWKNFQGSWGKRDSVNFQDEAEEISKKSNGWSKLHGAWGKRYISSLDNAYLHSLLDTYSQPSLSSSYGQTDEDVAMPQKREWSKFAGSWGKRPFGPRTLSPRSTNWSSLRGSWGKRAGDWSQFRGTWGKKASDF